MDETMKIDVTHPEITPLRWQRCRDASDGQDAIHAGSTLYLPKLTGQKDQEYKAYRDRTPFFNATARTIDGLVGMVYRKYPKTIVPAAFQPIADDLTLEGESVDLVSKEV